MRAVVFHKPHDVRVERVPDPSIRDRRDAIVRVTSTAICGSDLHIFNGLFPQARPLVLGHEFMGIVEDVGRDVDNLKKGDRVVVPFPIACGRCWFCERRAPTACERSNENYGPEGGLLTQKGAGLFGYTDLYGGYDGGQAEAVRVPFADYGPRKVPAGLTDAQALFLTDILPTGYAAIDQAQLRGGEVVAVFGCGPVGLMAQKCAWLRGASRVIGVDVREYRLAKARETTRAETIDASMEDPIARIRAMTEGRGADVCVDAVGMEVDRGLPKRAADVAHHQAGAITAIEHCVSAVRRGGVISIVGVYGTAYANFPMGQIMDKGIRLWAGQAPVHNYIDELMTLIASGKLRADDVITHVLPLDEAALGYEVFNTKSDGCVKVVLETRQASA